MTPGDVISRAIPRVLDMMGVSGVVLPDEEEEFRPTGCLFVEAHGVAAGEAGWVIVGRFLYADLLGGFTPERRDRLVSDAAGMLRDATHQASRRAKVE
jgi:hypothetical protein